jgi:hypothetical protein
VRTPAWARTAGFTATEKTAIPRGPVHLAGDLAGVEDLGSTLDRSSAFCVVSSSRVFFVA